MSAVAGDSEAVLVEQSLEIEGIGVLTNPVEGVEVNPKFAQQIDLKDIV